MEPKSLKDVLGRLSRHLDILAEKALTIEDAVSGLIEDREPGSREVFEGLQSLDYIRQSLEDLAVLCHLLKAHLSADLAEPFDAVTLASNLKLRDTQNLVIKPSLKSGNNSAKVSGDLDLF